MVALQGRRQGIEIDDGAARVVDEDGALLHGRDLARRSCPGWPASRHVHGDDVGFGEQLVQAIGRLDVAVAQLVGVVVVDDAHAHRLGDDRELGADVA
jgi:hypothetical protein